MSVFTPTYIYIGNMNPLFNADWNGATAAEQDTTLSEASVMEGKEFSAQDMQGVQISADSRSSTNIIRGETPIDYTLQDYDLAGDPIGTGTQHSVVYTGHVVMNVDIVVERTMPDGSVVTETVSNLRAAVIQMSNGDLFMRPYYLDKAQWESSLDGAAISKIELKNIVEFPSNPTSATDAYTDGMNGSAGFSPTFVRHIGAPCFVAGTLIATEAGPRPVESLKVGDLVLTRDHGAQPVRWIGRTRIEGLSLARNARLRPIRLGAGTLGANLPDADLLVSPQHRVLVRSRIAQTMYGTDEVLVAARQLTELEGIAVAEDLAAVDYVHVMFDRHEIVLSNGAETESLYAGPVALEGIGAAARAELLEIFPELAEGDHLPHPARLFAEGHKARRMAARHAKNERPLIGG